MDRSNAGDRKRKQKGFERNGKNRREWKQLIQQESKSTPEMDKKGFVRRRYKIIDVTILSIRRFTGLQIHIV